MPIKLLSEIPLYKAGKKDMARAINYSMKSSKQTAWTMVRALNLHGSAGPAHLDKLYGADAFTKENLLNETTSNLLIKQVRRDLHLPRNQFVSLMDYAKAFVKEVAKR